MKKMIVLLILLFTCCSESAAGWMIFPRPGHTVRPASLITDYFRSKASGAWSAAGTWESSPDNGVTPWANATLTPASASATVTIRNGHTVTVSTNQTVDEVVVLSGGVLVQNMTSGITLTVNDGIGDDIVVESGGIFQLLNNTTNGPVFSGSATCNINTGGMLRLSTTGLTFPNTGVNAVNYIYQHASILEYTETLAFASSGVTIFPNVNANTIPVFRTTANLGNIGGGSDFVINGVYEAQGAITFTNAGLKIFRNGIIGNGKISSVAGSGKFVINGLTASLGGTDSLKLPTAGLDIGPNTTVTLTSSKTITGNIALLNNALVYLGNFNLNLSGDISGGTAISHLVTNGTGKLILNNIGAAARFFPVGATAAGFNPMSISNGDGFNYGVRVETGINPPIAEPHRAVNRTWFVTPSGGTPGTVNTIFYYSPGDGNANFNYTSNVELGFYDGAWNVIQQGLTPSGSYQVSTTVNVLGNNLEAPFVLGNLWSILSTQPSISVDYFNGRRQNNGHELHWKISCNHSSSVNIELQRSADGRNFTGIFSLLATAARCRQPFDFTDITPAAGVNFYRLKLTDADGKVSYSSTISLLHNTWGVQLLHVNPNPVEDGFCTVHLVAEKSGSVTLVIIDLQGRMLRQQEVSLIAGSNPVRLDLAMLSAGNYQLALVVDGVQVGMTRIVKQ